MGREYRVIQPSKYEGKVTRKAAEQAFRTISESKNAVVRARAAHSGLQRDVPAPATKKR